MGERARRRQLYKCEYYRKKAERRRKKTRKREKKSEGESFTPRMTRRKFARERSALATRFIMRSRERVHVCTYAVHDFVNPALDRSYYAINFNSRPIAALACRGVFSRPDSGFVYYIINTEYPGGFM